MSQAQPTIEKIHSLRKKQETALKSLTLIGYLEGTSFLLLSYAEETVQLNLVN